MKEVTDDLKAWMERFKLGLKERKTSDDPWSQCFAQDATTCPMFPYRGTTEQPDTQISASSIESPI